MTTLGGAAGQLHHGVAAIEDQDARHQQQQIFVVQHIQIQELAQQHQTAHHQQSQRNQAEPVHPRHTAAAGGVAVYSFGSHNISPYFRDAGLHGLMTGRNPLLYRIDSRITRDFCEKPGKYKFSGKTGEISR